MDKLATIDIKGKDYVLVNERIRAFRENYKGYRLSSDIVSLENGVCVIKATVQDENGNVVATGHAYEKEGSTYINKTSYIENCETSAWGRALGNLGIGIDTSIASYEEVANAVVQQKQPTAEGQKAVKEAQKNFDDKYGSPTHDELVAQIINLCDKKGKDLKVILEFFNVKSLDDMTYEELLKTKAKLMRPDAK